jgi:hypothetical protein
VRVRALHLGAHRVDLVHEPGFRCAAPAVTETVTETVAETGADGIPYVSLNALLELKLASGMTAAHRPQDLADVIELIRVNRLPLEHGDLLNPYVAEKYRDLWRAAQTVDDY